RQGAHLRYSQDRGHDRHAGEGCGPRPRARPGAGEQTRRADARPRHHGRGSRLAFFGGPQHLPGSECQNPTPGDGARRAGGVPRSRGSAAGDGLRRESFVRAGLGTMEAKGTGQIEAPKLYNELAEWWPLMSAPADYAEEAALYQRALLEACERPAQTLLELGSGGGNNASHLKARFSMVLVDRSPGMLRVSRALNPDCEHVEGDMRTVRLGREFDCVFVHDAVVYMTTEDDLRRAIETAYLHCKPGG